VRVVEQPQLQGPAGLADRAHAADVPAMVAAAALRGAVADVREIL
jgi:hypothetical protein